MEQRTEVVEVKQVKLYILVLNNMRSRFEDTSIVAVSTGINPLVNFMEAEKAPELYVDEEDTNMIGCPLRKTFLKGSPLEYFNPTGYSYSPSDIQEIHTTYAGQTGIFYQWIDEYSLDIVKQRYHFIEE